MATTPAKKPAAKKAAPKKSPEAIAEERKISQVGDFKKRLGGVMELPSGFMVKARNPGGLQAFLQQGLIPNSLMPIIQKALATGKSPSPKEMLGKNGEIDPDMIASMMSMLDTIAVKVIVDPVIHPAPETEADRSDEKLYVDELPMDDKQFLMQWVSGGTRDLETFRQRFEQGVDNVAEVASSVRAAQSSAGIDPR